MTRARLIVLLLATTLCAACEQGPIHRGRTLASWVADLDAKEEFRRRGSCDAIGEIGPVASQAIPALVERLEDEDPGVRFAAEQALGKMGPAAVPQLEPALKSINPETRLHAVIALLAIDPSHARAGETLVRAAVTPGFPEIAEQARSRSVRLGAAILPRLLPLLDDPSADVRIVVLEMMEQMRLEAVDAVEPVVARNAKEPEAKVRRQIALTLGRIGPKEKVEAHLRAMLDDKDETVAAAANSMISFVGAFEAPTTGEVKEVEAQAIEEAEAARDRGLKSMLKE